jgi:phosphatidylinositol alpha-1,6-mannosyltransferase
LPPSPGGLQRYTVELTRALAATDRVRVVGETGQTLGAHPARLHHVEALRETGDPATFARTCAALARLVAQTQPDLIHLASANLAVFRDALPRSVPVAVTVHGNDLTAPWQRHPSGDARRAIVDGLSRCQLGLAVSGHTAQLAAGLQVALPLYIEPPACDLTSFTPGAVDAAKVWARLDVPTQGRPVVLTVTRLATRKGLERLLEALVRVHEPFHWVVVGRGSLRHRLRALARERGLKNAVTLVGELDDAALRDAYRAAAVFALVPEVLEREGGIDSEGFGMVFHEANACGLAVVASRHAGCLEAVVDGVSGVSVDPLDVDEIAAAIQGLLSDEARRRALAASGLAYVRSLGGWPAAAARLRRRYQALTGLP